MSRKLSKKQIKFLDDKCTQFYTDFDELPVEYQEALEKMNNYETLYQDINRYLLDKKVSALGNLYL